MGHKNTVINCALYYLIGQCYEYCYLSVLPSSSFLYTFSYFYILYLLPDLKFPLES